MASYPLLGDTLTEKRNILYLIKLLLHEGRCYPSLCGDVCFRVEVNMLLLNAEKQEVKVIFIIMLMCLSHL